MKGFSFWQRWLFVVGLLIIVFGTMMALFSGTALFEVFNAQVNPVFWGEATLPDDVEGFQQWIYGVLGATMAGWGVSVAFIARYPFRRKEKWSWSCLVAGLLLWLLIDTAISLNFKVYFNAIFNTLVFMSAMLPMIFTAKHFLWQGGNSP